MNEENFQANGDERNINHIKAIIMIMIVIIESIIAFLNL
jgi:hypothetical protein